MWLVVHKKVMCNVERVHRGFVLYGSYKRCPGHLEDLYHIFRNCDVVVIIWQKLLPLSIISSLSNLNYDNWVRTNLFGRVNCDYTNDWSALFAVILWWLWR